MQLGIGSVQRLQAYEGAIAQERRRQPVADERHEEADPNKGVGREVSVNLVAEEFLYLAYHLLGEVHPAVVHCKKYPFKQKLWIITIPYKINCF